MKYIDMQTDKDSETFWVYILQSNQHNEWRIATTQNLQQVIASVESGRPNHLDSNELVYARAFNDMLLALGYKLLLSTLHPKSVEAIIRTAPLDEGCFERIRPHKKR